MTFLVTGARGNVGRHVLASLLAADAPVRAMSRDPESATFPAGVEVVAADLTRPDTLAPALADVSGVFLYVSPEGIDGFLDAAKTAGVERIVLLSSIAATHPRPESNPIAHMHAEVERAIVGSGLPWTFLQPGAFAANALQWASSIRDGEVVRSPYPDAHTTPIHEADIAAVGVAALTGEGHDGVRYELTGPESITMQQQVELIGAALGRSVPFERQSPAEFRADMTRFIPEPLVDALLAFWAEADDRPQPVSDTVEKVTGTRARTFAQWATDRVEAFR